MTHYQTIIKEATNCKNEELGSIEDIMRETIFHSTLDWQSKKQLVKGAKEAYEIHNEIQKLITVHGDEWYLHV